MLLIIIRGLPGSGKSTLAQKLALPGSICEADNYFMQGGQYKFDPTKLKEAHEVCQTQARNLMSSHYPASKVVVSNTFTQKREYQPYLDMAEEYGYEVQIIECHGRWNSVHNVPDEAIDRMRERWEPTEL